MKSAGFALPALLGIGLLGILAIGGIYLAINNPFSRPSENNNTSTQPSSNSNDQSGNHGLIGGVVFIDANRNGKWEIGETPLNGATLILNDGAASVKSGMPGTGQSQGRYGASASDTPGYFYFYLLEVGSNTPYTITLNPPEGYEITTMQGIELGPEFDLQTIAENKVSLKLPFSTTAPDVLRFGVYGSSRTESIPTQSSRPSSSQGPCREVTTSSPGPGGQQIQIKSLDCSPQ